MSLDDACVAVVLKPLLEPILAARDKGVIRRSRSTRPASLPRKDSSARGFLSTLVDASLDLPGVLVDAPLGLSGCNGGSKDGFEAMLKGAVPVLDTTGANRGKSDGPVVVDKTT